MINRLKKIALIKKIFAIILIIIGSSGIILPILPGWPLVFWGLFILGGIGLIDRVILKYLPKKWRKYIIGWISKFEKK